MSRFRREGLILGAILLLAAIIRVAVFMEFRDRMTVDVTYFPEFDTYTWHQYGTRIASGDLLLRDAFIPCHSWAQAIAPPEQWIAWYGGPSAFYQAPLYGYFVGAVYAATGVAPDHVRVVQLALGVLRALLIYLIARRLFSGWIPLLAALIAAVYAPFVFFELNLLRESMLGILQLLGLLLLLVGMQRRRVLWWGLAGLVAGIEFLGKPSVLPLGAVFLALLAGGPPGVRLRRTMVYVFCLAIPLGLLVARNHAVGQPLFQIDTRGPVTFVAGNAPDAVVENAQGFFVPPSTAPTIWKSQNRLPATVLEVLRQHKRAPAKLLELWGRKIRVFWRDYEVPNNVNFYNARNLVAGLRLPFTGYAFVFPFAVLGLIVTRRRWRDMVPLYTFMTLIFAYTIAFIVLARFRLFIVPYLIVFAAAGLVWLGEAVRTRRPARVALAVVLFAIVLSLSARDPGWAPNVIQSRLFVQSLEGHQRLVEQRDPGIEREVRFEEAEKILYRVKDDYESGRYGACIEPLERVLASFPDLAYTRYVLARCRFEVYLKDPGLSDYLEQAERELGRVFESDPSAPYAQGLRQAIAGIRGRGEVVASPDSVGGAATAVETEGGVRP